jgi:3-oxoacyl-[acyl-carrier-protein] synthase II
VGAHRDCNPKIVVLGYDAVSPLGTELAEQLRRARAGESGVRPLTRFPMRDDDFPVRVAGEVPTFDPAPYDFLTPRKMALWKSPIFSHGMLTVHRALQRAGLEITPDLAPRVAVTYSTAIGGLDAVIAADREMVELGRLPMNWVNPNSCVNMIGGKISILTGATGPIACTVTACATGSTSMITGAMYLQAKMADVALCGAVDMPLIEPIVAGFATMNGAYKPRRGDPPHEPPARASRPFSADRRGFVVSEGAACVVLATADFARAHGLSPRIELAGWATNADAHHFVAPNPATVGRCMADAVAHAGLTPREIDAVNAHAASTKVGDAVEAQTLGQLFGDRVPPVSANKSQIGHAMGASSAIESVFAMEGLLEGYVLPTINHTPDPEIDLDCVAADEARPLQQEHVLKNAFGFGGCNACLVFRRIG